MNKKTKLLLTLIIISCISIKTAYSQDSISSKPIFLQASFLYDFPRSFGITAGIDLPYKSIIKKRISKEDHVFTKQKDKFFGIEAAAYRYPYNYTGLLLVPTIGTRHYRGNSFFYETSLGIGVMRTFYDGTVYEIDASGNVQQKSFYGRFYATTHLASAFNFLLQKQGHKIVALQVKPSVWFQYPFESFIKPHVSLEAGIKYEIKERSTKSRMKVKHLRK